MKHDMNHDMGHNGDQHMHHETPDPMNNVSDKGKEHLEHEMIQRDIHSHMESHEIVPEIYPLTSFLPVKD
jgi:hypothetical protein